MVLKFSRHKAGKQRPAKNKGARRGQKMAGAWYMARQVRASLYGVRMAKKGKAIQGRQRRFRAQAFSSSQSRQAKGVRKFAIRQFPDKKASAIFGKNGRFFGSQVLFLVYSKQSSVQTLFTLRERLLCRQGGLKFCAFVLYFNTAIFVPKFPFFRLYFNVLKFSPQRTGVALPNQLT